MRPDINIKPTMFAANIATINAGATYSTPSDAIDVSGLDFITLWLKSTGANASSAGSVTFNLVYSGDGTTYSTTIDPFVLTLATNTAVVSKPIMLDVRGINKIKVLTIVNGDASYAISATNVLLTCVKN
jgi:hypothetical protein